MYALISVIVWTPSSLNFKILSLRQTIWLKNKSFHCLKGHSLSLVTFFKLFWAYDLSTWVTFRNDTSLLRINVTCLLKNKIKQADVLEYILIFWENVPLRIHFRIIFLILWIHESILKINMSLLMGSKWD